jgi:hypothetical protein
MTVRLQILYTTYRNRNVQHSSERFSLVKQLSSFKELCNLSPMILFSCAHLKSMRSLHFFLDSDDKII